MSHTWTVHLLEMRYEFLKAWRLPAYSLPTLAFPVVFYLFFGVMFGSKMSTFDMARYLIATYSVFGAMGAALFGFGVSVAIERGQGWLETKRTTPMPLSAFFISKLGMAMIFSAIIFGLLLAAGAIFGDVRLTASESLLMLVVVVAGSIPFCALGLMMGFLAGPNSAAPIVNLVYLPMGFLSGLWIPVNFLPDALQDLAMWLPPYHAGQIALKVIGADRGDALALNVLALAVSTILFLSLAWVGYRRDEGKTYG
jgi:ABC-2 type transport system permease protein